MLTVHFLVLGVTNWFSMKSSNSVGSWLFMWLCWKLFFCQIHCWCNYVLMSMQILGCVSCSSGVLLALPLWDTRESNVFNPLVVFMQFCMWMCIGYFKVVLPVNCKTNVWISIFMHPPPFVIELLSGSSGGFRFRFVVGIQICFKDCDL